MAQPAAAVAKKEAPKTLVVQWSRPHILNLAHMGPRKFLKPGANLMSEAEVEDVKKYRDFGVLQEKGWLVIMGQAAKGQTTKLVVSDDPKPLTDDALIEVIADHVDYEKLREIMNNDKHSERVRSAAQIRFDALVKAAQEAADAAKA